VYIYRILNTVTQDFYVGKTVSSINRRWKTHQNSLKHNIKTGKRLTHLQNAIMKYGKEKFILEELEKIDNKKDLSLREIFWIAKLSPQYNMTMGGEGCGRPGIPKSKEHKHKIKKSKKGLKWFYDPKTLEEKQISHISLENYKNWLPGRSPKTKHGGKLGEYNTERSSKISNKNKGRTAPNKGICHSNETKEKIRIKRLNYLSNGGKHGRSKEIVLDNVKYNSMKEANEKTGLSFFLIRKKLSFS
jgi:group I intron endonuclease